MNKNTPKTAEKVEKPVKAYDELPPSTLRIGYQKINVSFDLTAVLGAQGAYKSEAQKIVIDGDLGEIEKANTMIHEILHAIFYTHGMREVAGGVKECEEYIVNTLANGLCQVFQDNPKMIKWISDQLNEKSV